MIPPLGLTLFLLVVFSVAWGRAILFNADKRYMDSAAMWLMRYIRASKQHIHSVLVGCWYVGTGVAGIFVFSLVWNVGIFGQFRIAPSLLLYLPLGFLAEMSVSSLVMSTVMLVTPRTAWVDQIRSIPWINAISLMPERLGPLIPLIGAFLEELFYRGVVFTLLVNGYPELGMWGAAAISAALFALQQILNTATLPQAVTMGIASVSISLIGCALMAYTGSFLPALFAHEAFVVFYFKEMGFSYKTASFSG